MNNNTPNFQVNSKEPESHFQKAFNDYFDKTSTLQKLSSSLLSTNFFREEISNICLETLKANGSTAIDILGKHESFVNQVSQISIKAQENKKNKILVYWGKHLGIFLLGLFINNPIGPQKNNKEDNARLEEIITNIVANLKSISLKEVE